MSWLITGIDGFVGKHFSNFLEDKGEKVSGTLRHGKANEETTFFLDLKDKNKIRDIVFKVKPDYLVLLAGLSSLRESYGREKEFMKINFQSTVHFLDAIKELNLNTKVLIISSGMVYCTSQNLLKETDPVHSNSPYSAAKLAQEKLIKTYSEIPIIVSRSFNHTGIGQKMNFIMPKLTSLFANSKDNNITINLKSTSPQRDFLNVIDVCRAYHLLLTEGKNGEIYNVCSSKPHSIKEIIEVLEEHTGKKAIINEEDKDSSNTKEHSFLAGDNSKILAETSWKPTISFKRTIINLYESLSH